MICKVYKIINKVNGKIYIGQTWRNINKRWKNGNGYKESLKLQNAINKYGKDNFKYEIIALCDSQKSADFCEKFFIIYFNSIKSGYNIREGGSRGRHSAETITKMSNAKKGKIVSQETRDKISKSLKGKKFTEERLLALKIINKGRLKSNVKRKSRPPISEKNQNKNV